MRQHLIRGRKRKAIEAQIAALELDVETEDLELEQSYAQQDLQVQQSHRDLAEMARSRGTSAEGPHVAETRVRPGAKK